MGARNLVTIKLSALLEDRGPTRVQRPTNPCDAGVLFDSKVDYLPSLVPAYLVPRPPVGPGDETTIGLAYSNQLQRNAGLKRPDITLCCAAQVD